MASQNEHIAQDGAVKKINLATPAYRNSYSGEFVQTFYNLIYDLLRKGIILSHSSIDYADIVTSRNFLISHFYFNKRDCSHMLFMDDDIGFSSALVMDMIDFSEDVVGALSPSRNLDLRKLHARGAEPFEQARANATDFIGELHPSGETRDGFARALKCGGGVMLISRAAVRRMIDSDPSIVADGKGRCSHFPVKFEKFLTPFDKVVVNGQELSEDYAFCWRWTQKCGGKIWVARHHKITHTGRMVFEGRFSDLD